MIYCMKFCTIRAKWTECCSFRIANFVIWFFICPTELTEGVYKVYILLQTLIDSLARFLNTSKRKRQFIIFMHTNVILAMSIKAIAAYKSPT
uniref:Uncharacterized protein n=1 Tax=Pararge aegeria TaxID=116150 RepID=S4PZP1_9NEOP